MKIALIILEYLKVLIWPITLITIILILKNPIINLLNRIKKAYFPGGVSIETFSQEIKRTKALSEQVTNEMQEKEQKKGVATIPLNEANAKMVNLGLNPSPSGLELSYYRNIAKNDPTLALAGLRIDFEIMLKNLAQGFAIRTDINQSISHLVNILFEKKAITYGQKELLNSVISLCNSAIHGLRITTKQACDILDIAEVLRDDYIAWLSWGFPKN